MRGMFKEVNVLPGDLVPNNTPSNCLKNVKYKLVQGLDLSQKNLLYVAAPDITDARIERRDLMQWALLKDNKTNVLMLTKFFDIRNYAGYLRNLSVDIQENMRDLFCQNNKSVKPGR